MGDLQGMLQDPHPRHLVFLGRRRLPVVAITREQLNNNEEFLAELAETGETQDFTLTFISDYQEENPFPLPQPPWSETSGSATLTKSGSFAVRARPMVMTS